MPWKLTTEKAARRQFLKARWEDKESMVALCRRFGISRQCGYEWWGRAQGGAAIEEDRSHRTKRAEALADRWRHRVLRLRRRYRFAGADQLVCYLQRSYPLGPWPGKRTIGRWLSVAGLTRKRRRRSLPGPRVELKPCPGLGPNDVWTVDFKGWFLTADGRRVCALTVRDMATRLVLHVLHMPRTNERAVAVVMQRLFRRHGLPRAIQVDNGPPFGGCGPYGWSTLAVGWVTLGIAVRYGRPACPQDNAAHEQMHQVLQTQTAKPAAASVAAQQRRFDRWRHRYNTDRPHRSLGMQMPISLYRPIKRLPMILARNYPVHWIQKNVDPRGRIRWKGRARLVGQAFGRQIVALCPVREDVVRVFFGPHLLGEIHAADTTAIRAVRTNHIHIRAQRQTKGGSQAPSLTPSP
jgi:putative transposase